MGFNGKLDIRSADFISKARGLEPGGKVQKFIDSEMIRVMNPLTPRRNGILIDSVTRGTVIGNGKLQYADPKARNHYYGKLMVSPTTGSSWARRGEKKVVTNTDMVYFGGPSRGPFWFERAKAEHKKQILNGARKIAGAT